MPPQEGEADLFKRENYKPIHKNHGPSLVSQWTSVFLNFGYEFMEDFRRLSAIVFEIRSLEEFFSCLRVNLIEDPIVKRFEEFWLFGES